MKHYTVTQLKRIATDLFKPQAKALPKKPSITMLKVRAAAAKLLTKYKKAK